MLTAGGKEIKNKKEILALLEAIWLSQKLAIIHCKGHQKGEDPVARGNRLAGEATREAALQEAPQILPLVPQPELSISPKYTHEEESEGQKLGGRKNAQGWLELPDHRIYLPQGAVDLIVKEIP